MTPEQIAAKVILDWNSKHTASDGDAPVSRGAAFGLHELIATALRQARADALEEAAQHHDAQAAFLENRLVAFPVVKGVAFNAEAIFHRKQAAMLRALKHKDQK